MKENLTEIIAMYGDNVKKAEFDSAVKAVKNKLKSSKENGGGENLRFTICSFGAELKALHENVPVEKIISSKKIKHDDCDDNYQIAMIDSAVKLAGDVGARYAATPEEEIPSRIIFVILALGKDNASKIYTYDKLKEIIEHQTYVYKWEFYLITDQPQNAEFSGILSENTVLIPPDTDGCLQNAVETLIGKLRK